MCECVCVCGMRMSSQCELLFWEGEWVICDLWWAVCFKIFNAENAVCASPNCGYINSIISPKIYLICTMFNLIIHCGENLLDCSSTKLTRSIRPFWTRFENLDKTDWKLITGLYSIQRLIHYGIFVYSRWYSFFCPFLFCPTSEIVAQEKCS